MKFAMELAGLVLVRQILVPKGGPSCCGDVGLDRTLLDLGLIGSALSITVSAFCSAALFDSSEVLAESTEFGFSTAPAGVPG